MAKKLKQLLDFSQLPLFHRKASFQLLSKRDYDELNFGDLFTIWVDQTTALTLGDATVLTRQKRLQVKIDGKEYRPYCHPETTSSGQSFKVKQISPELETRGSDRYEVRSVTPAVFLLAPPEPLPEWAVIYLEDVAQGYGSEESFERLMWEICITPIQEQWLNQHRLTLQHLSEGRTPGHLCYEVEQFYLDWNQKLGEPFWGG